MAGTYEGRGRRWRGVHKRTWGRWLAEIRKPRSTQRIWLGSYTTAEESARAYDAAALCLRGDGAFLNFPSSISPNPLSGISPPQVMSRRQIQWVAAAAASATATCVAQGVHGYSNMQTNCNIQPARDSPVHAAVTSHPHVVDAPDTCLCGNGVKTSQLVSPCSNIAEENMILESSVQSLLYQKMPAEIGVLLAPSQIVLQQRGSSVIIDGSQVHPSHDASERSSFDVDFMHMLHSNSQFAIPAMAEHLRRRRLHRMADHSSGLHPDLQGIFINRNLLTVAPAAVVILASVAGVLASTVAGVPTSGCCYPVAIAVSVIGVLASVAGVPTSDCYYRRRIGKCRKLRRVLPSCQGTAQHIAGVLASVASYVLPSCRYGSAGGAARSKSASLGRWRGGVCTAAQPFSLTRNFMAPRKKLGEPTTALP
ncbi:hypothetical protein GOP47_0015507 [Adiantum capillus-veneris]|uniref:AP2/ERF domain-containing protein n=1 Tax=Adiantum capillus-veneris TaxID=13818 RepID=A0A9D4ZE15_ADICA|nr:hypothetical protein GOP47_0015507 [Adiantum capillus-veneris]